MELRADNKVAILGILSTLMFDGRDAEDGPSIKLESLEL